MQPSKVVTVGLRVLVLTPFHGLWGSISKEDAPSQTQHREGWFEPHCWELFPHGNGYGHSGFRKGRKCTSGLADVVGSGQGAALLGENLAGDVESGCFPTGSLPEKLELTQGSPQDPGPISSWKGMLMLATPPALFLCRGGAAAAFYLLAQELLGWKNIFLALNPSCSTHLEKLLPAG